METQALIRKIREAVIGSREIVNGPFGRRPVIYADYTASGRALDFIEDYIRDAVLPLYANTHTESSGTGLQTTRFREEAREIIGDCVGAQHDEHVVLFAGSGTTGAIDRMIGCLGLRIPSELDDRHALTQHIPEAERPVVFIGPFEHHSNEVPWRESIADVVTIREDADGHVDLALLREELERYADRPLKIGSFSAASNVTGIISDTSAISRLLHEHAALAFWDFAAAAPYVEIEMGTAADGGLDYKDAVFVSPHKLIGGPGTPGLLIARRELFRNRVPDVPGGGTVWYVNPESHNYLDDIEHREEGGTPAIVESIRAGLVFQLKEAVGVDTIRELEEGFIREAIARWSDTPNIEVLGNPSSDRLSIVSFVIRHGTRHLHHNFVVALLNDLFGIQARGGCSCAGPYGHRLLGIDLDRSHAFEREIARGCEGLKPGWVRVNFNYFIDRHTFDYVIEAVQMVAEHGWKLLPLYEFEPRTGLWRHRDGFADPPMSLHDISYEEGRMRYRPRRHEFAGEDLAEYLEASRTVLAAGTEVAAAVGERLSDDFRELQWFPLPEDVAS
jgi:selenocysteine lyase/cysteine desulfurase